MMPKQTRRETAVAHATHPNSIADTGNGTSLAEMRHAFPDNDGIVRHLLCRQANQLLRCQVCGNLARFRRTHRERTFVAYCCVEFWFSVTARTLFASSTLPLQIWFTAMLYFANSKPGFSADFLGAMLGLGHNTAHRVADRIRTHIALLDEDRQLGGAGKPVALSFVVLRGLRGKRQVTVAALHDGTSVVSAIVPNRTISTLAPFILRHVKDHSIMVYSDEMQKRLLTGSGKNRSVHRKFQLAHESEFVFETGLIISYFTNLKRVLRGAHIHIYSDHLWKLIGEFNFKFNRRKVMRDVFWDMIAEFPPLPKSKARSDAAK